MHNAIVAVFASREAVEGARAHLVEAGVADERIGVSTNLTEDGVAAEMPGQSYANQPCQPGAVDETELYADAARSGTYVLRVELEAGADRAMIDDILRRWGGRNATHPG